MKKLLLIITVSLFVFALNAQTILDTALNFTVKDTYGNTIELFDILDAGQMVVIDFFSTT
ncbi:MAG: hypothetical protein K8R86_05510 [Bacteroidales bacterium]|nr:hypothetical protein [Bacteroidales bacterium]